MGRFCIRDAGAARCGGFEFSVLVLPVSPSLVMVDDGAESEVELQRRAAQESCAGAKLHNRLHVAAEGRLTQRTWGDVMYDM